VAFFTNIIHRFGVPNSIITDNGTQFTGRKFLDFCEDHHIRVDWAVVAHPMTNGQVERANDMILQGLKPRIYNDLHKFGRRWMKELPLVRGGHFFTINRKPNRTVPNRTEISVFSVVRFGFGF
jgi:transposase InsO family protein